MSFQRLFASINAAVPKGTAQGLLTSLLDEQLRTWPLLVEGCAALASSASRTVACDGFTLTLQHNPRRIVSTGANVDEKSIRERRCFLCPENLPLQQKAVAYRAQFLVLCNPNPIFEKHFTVSSAEHIPQALAPNLGTFLSLIEDFSPAFSVFYNGPECGASAPDHLHFQVTPAGAIPVERDAADDSRRMTRKVLGTSTFSSLGRYGRKTLIIESHTKEGMAASIERLLAAMKKSLGTADEPKLNLLSSLHNGRWRTIVFPRAKHRADSYFLEETSRITVSPALVDMGGMVITPVKKDFERLDAKTLENILKEVSVSHPLFEKICDEI